MDLFHKACIFRTLVTKAMKTAENCSLHTFHFLKIFTSYCQEERVATVHRAAWHLGKHSPVPYFHTVDLSSCVALELCLHPWGTNLFRASISYLNWQVTKLICIQLYKHIDPSDNLLYSSSAFLDTVLINVTAWTAISTPDSLTKGQGYASSHWKNLTI